jgi:4-amino-4-deoxy-L-arabinose transferase-like glycosyltransferase
MKIYKILLLAILILSFFLRFYKFDINPPGLYIDEVSIGNNASDILTTGKDEFGESFPLFFKAFGEYKMPVYIYMTSLSISIFGKNEMAIRFPSALLGSLTILIFYFFVRKLLSLNKDSIEPGVEKTALLASFLLAITPWHLHFSRGGFEATIALFFFLSGFVLFLYFFENKKSLIIGLSLLMFSLSVYSYNAYRVIAPISVLFLSFLYIYTFPKEKKTILGSLILFGMLILPLVIFSLSPQGSERFSQTSVFREISANSLGEKIIQFPLAVFRNYLSFFSFNFLFDTGDGIGRHQIHNFGPLFKWQLPFLLIGIFALIKIKEKLVKWIILFLILISPLSAAFAVPSPHTLRSLTLVIPLTFLVSLGLIYLLERIHKFKIFLIIILFLAILYEFLIYSHFYFVHYPKVNDLDWGSGYKEMLYKANDLGNDFDYIIFDKEFKSLRYYSKFYIGNENPKIVGPEWTKPQEWKDKKLLYIRPYYGSYIHKNIIYEVSLPHDKSFIFAQFYSL